MLKFSLNLSNLRSLEGSERIAVYHLDGSPEHLGIAKIALEDHDLIVESFTSPNELLRCIKDRRCDCLISSYKLGAMTFRELVSKVRELKDVKLFLYTSFDRDEIDEKILDDINGFFRKDSRLEQYDEIAKLLKTR